MKNPLNGWQVVTLVGMVLATMVALVWMGQTLGAIASVGVVILAALGYNVSQTAATKDLANGNLAAMRDQLAEKDKQYAEDMARKDNQMAMERAVFQQTLAQAHAQTVSMAAALPPDTKLPETQES